MVAILLVSAALFTLNLSSHTFAKRHTSQDCQIYGEAWYYDELQKKCCPCATCGNIYIPISTNQDCLNFYSSRSLQPQYLCNAFNSRACCPIKMVRNRRCTIGDISAPKSKVNTSSSTTTPTTTTSTTTTSTTTTPIASTIISTTISTLILNSATRHVSSSLKNIAFGIGYPHIFVAVIGLLVAIIAVGVGAFCWKRKCGGSSKPSKKKSENRQDEIIKREEGNTKEIMSDESSSSLGSRFSSQTDSDQSSEKELLSNDRQHRGVSGVTNNSLQTRSNEDTPPSYRLRGETELRGPHVINHGSNEGVIANFHTAQDVHIHHHYNSPANPNPPAPAGNSGSYFEPGQPSTGVPRSFGTSDYGREETLPKYPSGYPEKSNISSPKMKKPFMSRDEHPLSFLTEKVQQDCVRHAPLNFSVQESRSPTEHPLPELTGEQFNSGETEVKELHDSGLTNDQFTFSGGEFTKTEVPRDDQSDIEGPSSSGLS